MLRVISEGSFANAVNFLDAILRDQLYTGLDIQAQQGVEALREATPKESGLTAENWTYELDQTSDGFTLWFKNTHIVDDFNVAIGLQYGHGTGTGGWIQGYDYINPALKPVFDQIQESIWREVQNA